MYEFDISDFRNIESAGFCYFDKPCLHPSRKMEVHDFIYMINGEWNICVDDKTYQMRNDDILILPAYRQHYGITPCSPKTKTMYFHIYTHPNDKIFNNQQTIRIILLRIKP